QGEKLLRLSADRIIDLVNLPTDFALSARQERARKSALSDKTITEPELSIALNTITWPCFYLDFETVSTALPLYNGHGCHQQVLTQFSIHRQESLDGALCHYAYLADSSRDCQRELAIKLIDDLEDKGSILVYSAFERKRITGLCDDFPDLAPELRKIL